VKYWNVVLNVNLSISIKYRATAKINNNARLTTKELISLEVTFFCTPWVSCSKAGQFNHGLEILLPKSFPDQYEFSSIRVLKWTGVKKYTNENTGLSFSPGLALTKLWTTGSLYKSNETYSILIVASFMSYLMLFLFFSLARKREVGIKDNLGRTR
jgi:hypothetical protein